MKTKIFSPDKASIKQAALIIKKGGLVAFPTETVYGLGADAFNPKAVAKIFEAKKRPYFDPLIIHIDDRRLVKKLCRKVNKRAKILMDRFWPGPLTLVLPKSKAVPDIVTAGLDTVAVRVPSHPVALALIKEAGVPIAAPSANRFGKLSPTEARHIFKQLKNRIEAIIDGGRCPIGVESTVVDVSSKIPRILRPGGLPIEELKKALGGAELEIETTSKRPRSPGQLKSHYQPATPLKIIRRKNFRVSKNIKAGFLAFKNSKNKFPFRRVEILSPSGDLREAATNFFAALHRLDKAHLDIIYAEKVPEKGLGVAIMDRLYKADVKNGQKLRKK
jgi:L-threonylcarbamoyladenylate synthase